MGWDGDGSRNLTSLRREEPSCHNAAKFGGDEQTLGPRPLSENKTLENNQ
jgi:hypothetical protein